MRSIFCVLWNHSGSAGAATTILLNCYATIIFMFRAGILDYVYKLFPRQNGRRRIKNSQISPIKRNVNIQGKHLDDWKKKKKE